MIQTLTSLLLLITVSSIKVVPNNYLMSDAIYKGSMDKIFLFIDESISSQTFMRDLLEAKEKVQDDSLSLSIIRKDVDETLFASLSKQFGLNLLPSNRPSITQRACPVLLFVNKQIQKYLFPLAEVNHMTFNDFIINSRSKGIDKFLKSEPNPPIQIGDCVKVVANTFQDEIINTKKQILLLIEVPECGNCRDLGPYFNSVASLLKVNSNLMLAKIDASENDIESLGRFQMKDYPILLYYFEDKSIPPIPYTGGRTDITMVDWIQKNTKYPWVCPWTLRVKKLEEQIQFLKNIDQEWSSDEEMNDYNELMFSDMAAQNPFFHEDIQPNADFAKQWRFEDNGQVDEHNKWQKRGNIRDKVVPLLEYAQKEEEEEGEDDL